MSDIYTLVKNDTAPQIKATITREDDGSVVDFENGTCKLKFRKKIQRRSCLHCLLLMSETILKKALLYFRFLARN